MKRMSEVTEVETWKYVDDDNDPDSLMLKSVPKHTQVYEISGPMFFAAADKILSISLTDKTHLRDLFDRTKLQNDKERFRLNEPNLFNF